MNDQWNSVGKNPKLEQLLRNIRRASALCRDEATKCRMKAEAVRQAPEETEDDAG